MENDPPRGDMAEYEAALKQAGCDLTPLDYLKKYGSYSCLAHSPLANRLF